MTRVLLAALILSGCTTAGKPTPEPPPEPTQSKVHCDLIFPQPAQDPLVP